MTLHPRLSRRTTGLHWSGLSPIPGRAPKVIDSLLFDNLTFLVTTNGRPFVPAGFTNWFRAMAVEAGLRDGLSPRGLRKLGRRRLAEAGCTPHEIMAISGHESLAEVTRYTIEACRRASHSVPSSGLI